MKALGSLVHDWVQVLSSRPNRAPRKMLFVGPFALARIAEKQAKAWRDQLSADLGEQFEVLVAEPPFDVDTDIEAKGYWLRPVARTEEARIRLLRKQALIGVISILEQASRVGPSLILGVGQ